VTKLAYLLDLPVLAELTRPDGNRRVFTLFQQRQSQCAVAAPTLAAWLRGLDGLAEGGRRQHLGVFTAELLRSGPAVLPFDRDAALWLARQAPRWDRSGKLWKRLAGEQAAIAATQELVWVTRLPQTLSQSDGVQIDDWFRP
jgi:predicted nucleic acid-binding protein